MFSAGGEPLGRIVADVLRAEALAGPVVMRRPPISSRIRARRSWSRYLLTGAPTWVGGASADPAHIAEWRGERGQRLPALFIDCGRDDPFSIRTGRYTRSSRDSASA